jgi:signal transduction histidine kinase/CheY-like chemotaxis protein
MTSELRKLQQQVQELQAQLKRYQKSNELLKRKVSRFTADRAAVLTGSPDEAGHGPAAVSQGEQHLQKNVFFENASHEIRSSMNGIMGMTNLVLETELSEDQRHYLEMVESSVDRLFAVVNEVLDFYRIEKGQLELETEDFNLKESLDHDLYVLSVAARKRGLDFSCTIAPDVPLYIHGDPGRLAQIVTSLTSNAIRFTDTGSISISIENKGYTKSKELRLQFSIADTGQGIAPQLLERMKICFKQDKRVGGAPSQLFDSIGLGLTVSSQLIKKMGGNISVESGQGGTVFRFEVPLREVPFIEDEERGGTTLENIQADPSYVLRGAKILLAEDEYINRVLIETILKQLGVEVDSVENGEDAVRLACNGNYQLVLMDIQMDEVDGLEATRRIRNFERREGGHVGIIALTALAMPGDREKCLQAGMDDYIPKPLQSEELIEVVSQFLTRRALIVGTDPATQAGLVRTLVESGWRVTIAESRRAALYEISLSRVDLVVLGLSAADPEGMLTVKVIRKLEEYSGKKARLVGILEEETDLDVDHHLLDSWAVKPVSPEELLGQMEVAGRGN